MSIFWERQAIISGGNLPNQLYTGGYIYPVNKNTCCVYFRISMVTTLSDHKREERILSAPVTSPNGGGDPLSAVSPIWTRHVEWFF